MQNKNKLFTVSIVAFLAVTLSLLTIPTATAATPTITLTPNAQAPQGSITITGTGFATTSSIGIAFGVEVPVIGELGNVTGTSYGPFTGTVAYLPIKPGSFVIHMNVNNGLSVYDITDSGNGALACTAPSFAGGYINYAIGQYATSSTIDTTPYTIVRTLGYTRYEYSVPSTGLTTNSTGGFTATVTVPNTVNGNLNVNAIDSQGNRATSTLNVIPEGFNIGIIVLLSLISVVVGTRFLRKPSKI
jgi:hypothetical protein